MGIGWLICLSGGKTIYRCPYRRREDGPVGGPVSGCWKWKGRDMFSPGYHSSGKSESTGGVDISSIYTYVGYWLDSDPRSELDTHIQWHSHQDSYLEK